MSKFLCNKCFYVKETEEAPDTCIVCGSDKTAFTKINYTEFQYFPDYWAEHLKEKINKIHENQILAGRNSVSFAFISDIHWGPNKKHSAALLKKVMDDCAIPYCVNGGDNVSGAGLCPASLIISELQEYSRHFSALESRMLLAQGNHDPSYSTLGGTNYYAENLTDDQLFEYMFRYETKYPDRVMSEAGSYFYAEDKAHKLRIVVLNPYDVPSEEVLPDGRAKYNKMRTLGYRQTQLEWFANVALNVPSSDWSVVLATHTSPSAGEDARNNNVILGLIDAFRNGKKYEAETECDIAGYNAKISADYTDKKGNFVLWVSGHTHDDRVLVTQDTLCLSVLSDWNHQHDRLPMQRTTGTTNEHAFDVFTIDFNRHKIYATRIGAGEDRVFDYKA